MIQLTVHPFSAEQVRLSQAQLVAIYADAFRPKPYHKTKAEIDHFATAIVADTERAGFTASVAQIESIGQPIGFCYGYTVSAETYFYELVAQNLDASLHKKWLANTFQLVEMAVLPDYQGRGVGGELHNLLLNSQPHPKAILATMQGETAASKLYRQRGWHVLIESMTVPTLGRDYQIMGIAKKGYEDS